MDFFLFILRSVVELAAFFALLWCFLVKGRREHPKWQQLKKFAYAHRGYHHKPVIPENSMAAFRLAAQRGWGAELDVHLMADGNLAVIHDSSLRRTAGADVYIEDLNKADLEKYTLEDSQEHIPLLEEVLPLFETRGALIIELKAERGNHDRLAEALYQRLEHFRGLYCIESFDPRAVHWFKKHAPEVVRGQLAANFERHPAQLSGYLSLILTYLLMNFWSDPDFVAYQFEDRNNPSLQLSRRLWGTEEASWTIRSAEDMRTALAAGSTVIFEQFDPEKAGILGLNGEN